MMRQFQQGAGEFFSCREDVLLEGDEIITTTNPSVLFCSLTHIYISKKKKDLIINNQECQIIMLRRSISLW